MAGTAITATLPARHLDRESVAKAFRQRRWSPSAASRSLSAANQNATITHLKAAASAVEAKSPSEGAAYRAWLLSVATNVSQAAKEGGFLGIGGTPVSTEEREALAQLAQALGIAAESKWQSER